MSEKAIGVCHARLRSQTAISQVAACVSRFCEVIMELHEHKGICHRGIGAGAIRSDLQRIELVFARTL
jgi:hypothetical protein